jgi:Tol biopolymer transport system component
VSDAAGSSLLEIFSRPGKHSGTPRWAPDGRRLAFDSSAAGNFDVYVIEPGSARAPQLTSDAATDAVPSWSPDGRWVYFMSDRTGRQEIWKVPATGGPAVQVTRNGGACVFASTDGTHIYYTKSDAGSALWTMPVAGGPERMVVPSVHSRNFVVVERGIHFMPVPGPDEPFSVHYLDFSTGAVQPVAMIEGRVGYGLAVSPDGRQILYSHDEREARDLLMVDRFR